MDENYDDLSNILCFAEYIYLFLFSIFSDIGHSNLTKDMPSLIDEKYSKISLPRHYYRTTFLPSNSIEAMSQKDGEFQKKRSRQNNRYRMSKHGQPKDKKV